MLSVCYRKEKELKMAEAGPAGSINIVELVEDLKLLGVFPFGDGSIDGMVKARQQGIEKLRKANGTLDEGYERILNDLKQARDRRHILQQYYKRVKGILQDIQAKCPQENDYSLAEGDECIKDLENERFVVLIAGETSAGKSSMINLLLNERVLPTDIKQNTLTVCEISYGAKREAVMHFDKPEMTPITLQGIEFAKIKQYIEKPTDDEKWCKRIEIKIPNRLLRDGVVIVDSPGIGDSKDVNKISIGYLKQASAFIYVINSPNAGGLQEDRLLRIVQEWKELYKGEKHKPLTAKSALFVCNKWDEVERNASHDDREKEDVQKHIISKLKQKIPDLDEESQVIKMSVYTATQLQKKFNGMSDDLNSLINGIQGLLPLCTEIKTQYFFWWISGLLTNFSYDVKGELRIAKRSQKEELLQTRKEIEEVQLKKLKEDTFIRETKEALSNHATSISERLRSYLQSDEVRCAFCTWTERDLPRIDDVRRRADSERLKEIYNACIAQRLESFLQKFENKEQLFTRAHADLEERFRQGVCNFEQESRNIDRVLVGEPIDQFTPFDVSPDKLRLSLDPGVKQFLVFTSAIFMPVLFPIGLAAGVLSAPVGAVLAVGKHFKDQQLKTDARLVLTDLSQEFLQAFIENEVFNRVMKEFTGEKDLISKMGRCHKELINKYDKKCEDLTRGLDETKGNKTVETLDALCKEVQDMNKNLMFDAIQHGIQLMDPPCQIDKRMLQCTEEMLGKSGNGTVYKGKYSSLGHGSKDVAVKKLSKTQHPSNVVLFLREAAMLMQLKHKHIVAFYGVAMDVQNYELISLALVFELCDASLKTHIFENENRIPWKTASAVAATCQWSKQILEALEFIHSKVMVHRDLKLENILISRRDHTIKLAGLGLATLEKRTTRTVRGTLLYIAPEVREGKVYDSRADMYSFGVMMWEMWFGKSAPDKLNSMGEKEVTQHISVEKPLGKGPFNLPPAKWIKLMVTCWHSDPCLRLTAEKSKDFIEKIKQNFVK